MFEGISGIITKKLWIFVIIFIAIIIGIALFTDVFNFNKSENAVNFILIKDVVLNSKDYIGTNITVRGFYYKADLPGGEAYITSERITLPIHDGSFENVDYLLVNNTGNNITFFDDVEYYFTGTLITKQEIPYQIHLIVFSGLKVIPV